nr:uncharacterized protein LOC131771864 isoform X4 [Pocillopora verrucosa]
MATEETKTPGLLATSGGEAENGDIIDPRTSVVTELQLSDISDDVGTCWRELGPKLDIPSAKIQNLDNDYYCSRDKANALLLMWKQKEGSSAVIGRLADALASIEKKCIAEKLLGVDDEKLPMCRNIPKGHVISLTVIHDLGVGLDKSLVCEDAQGNKFMTLVSRRFLETVVDEKKESLKRYISAQLQDQRLQIKKEKSARGDVNMRRKRIQQMMKAWSNRFCHKPRHFSESDPPKGIGSKNPLLRLRSGDKEACVLLSISKPSSDEEYQSKDSGAGKKHRRTHHCLQKKN